MGLVDFRALAERSRARRGAVACTGHRPDKLGGWDIDWVDRLLDRVAIDAVASLTPRPQRLIVGMAPGWDFACARAAYSLDIPYTAAVPFTKQPSRWTQRYRDEWSELCERADFLQIVTPDGSFDDSVGGVVKAMHDRNEWMVDRGSRLLALWNGTPGGTAGTVRYARNCGYGVEIINVWDQYEKLWKGRRSTR